MAKINEILEQYESGTLKIKTVLENESLLKKVLPYWTDFNDSEKMNTLIETVEKDPSFDNVKKEIENIDTYFIGNEVDESMREAVSNLDDFNKFIAMGYVATKKGIHSEDSEDKKLHRREIILDFSEKHRESKDSKRELINFGTANYRISSWEQKNSRTIAKTFNLEHRFSSWDGETVIHDPIHNKWGVGWSEIFDTYLKQKGIIKEDFNSNKKKAENILKTVEELKGINEEELSPYIGDKNLIRDYESLKEIINADYRNPENGVTVKITSNYVGVNDHQMYMPINDEHIKSAEDAQRYGLMKRPVRNDVKKTNYAGFNVYKDGELILSKQMDEPYFVYEDFPGGQTIHRNNMKIEKINNVKIGDILEINYQDGNGKSVTESYKKK
jgi:hypothetical protein